MMDHFQCMLNSASLSTNFLMSHRRPTRSTLTFSRAIISSEPASYLPLGTCEHEHSAVLGRYHVQLVGNHNRSRVSAPAAVICPFLFPVRGSIVSTKPGSPIAT